MDMTPINALEFPDDVDINAQMKQVKRLEFPEMFKPLSTTMSSHEESKILAKVVHGRSTVKFVVAQGTICRCKHGKAKHAHAHNSHRAGGCNLKTCKCDSFQKPKYN